MSYKLALIAAGATVIDTKYAGSYQGTWGSIVEYNGKKGLVTGSFGSCSVCDAFQAEFDYSNDEVSYDEKTGKYYKGYYLEDDNEITKEEYEAEKLAYQQKLAKFGESYLHVIQDKQDIQTQLDSTTEDEWYDEERKELLDWAIKFFD